MIICSSSSETGSIEDPSEISIKLSSLLISSSSSNDSFSKGKLTSRVRTGLAVFSSMSESERANWLLISFLSSIPAAIDGEYLNFGIGNDDGLSAGAFSSYASCSGSP